MAIDEDIGKLRTLAEGVAYPVLVDADHVLTELYAISNVPTVLLIDGDDRIAQPNWNAYGTDTFRDFTNIDSDAQHDVIRRWVRTGVAPMTADRAKNAVGDLSDDEQKARLHFRLAIVLRDRGDEAGSERNFDRAAELAPHDWTIRRAMIPLRGGDPFGQEFFDLLGEHTAAGSPYHGVRAHDIG